MRHEKTLNPWRLDNPDFIRDIEDRRGTISEMSKENGTTPQAEYKHPPSHLDHESPLYKGLPHLWIQWKGTDVCCDIHCACGAHLHFDGDFLYFFQCPHCGQHWECGTHIPIYPVSAERATSCCQVVDPDEDFPLKSI